MFWLLVGAGFVGLLGLTVVLGFEIFER